MNYCKNKTFATLIGFCALCATSCHPVYYQPTTQHTPLFTQKGELYVSANYQGGDRVDASNMHVAYAADSHFGIGLNGNFVGADLGFTKKSSLLKPSRSNFGEMNMGYFTSSRDKQYVFEIYGGFGKGYIENNLNKGFSKVHLTRWSVQPAVAWRKKYFALILSSRFSFLDYVVQANTFSDPEWFRKTNLLSQRTIPLFEPALMLRVGGKQVKGFMQVITSTKWTNRDSSFLYNPVSINIGITVNLNML